MSVIDNLIFDRTGNDVLLLQTIKDKIKSRTATAEEWQAYLTANKAAYNYTDLNRIGEAIAYVKTTLEAIGIIVNVNARQDWAANETPTQANLNNILDSVETIRSAVAVYDNTPTTPESMELMTFGKANDIEKILKTVYDIAMAIPYSWKYCGISICGVEEGLR